MPDSELIIELQNKIDHKQTFPDVRCWRALLRPQFSINRDNDELIFSSLCNLVVLQKILKSFEEKDIREMIDDDSMLEIIIKRVIERDEAEFFKKMFKAGGNRAPTLSWCKTHLSELVNSYFDYKSGKLKNVSSLKALPGQTANEVFINIQTADSPFAEWEAANKAAEIKAALDIRKLKPLKTYYEHAANLNEGRTHLFFKVSTDMFKAEEVKDFLKNSKKEKKEDQYREASPEELIEIFKSKYKDLTGDSLKTSILQYFKREIESITDVDALTKFALDAQNTLEYKVLATGQGVTTRFINLFAPKNTSSVEAFNKMIAERQEILVERQNLMKG